MATEKEGIRKEEVKVVVEKIEESPKKKSKKKK